MCPPCTNTWPNGARRLSPCNRLVVEVEGSGPVATDLDPDAPPPDPATWALLFDPDRVGVRRTAWDADALHPRYTVAPCALTMLTLPLG